MRRYQQARRHSGGPHRDSGPSSGMRRKRGGSGRGKHQRGGGPITCPMCGAVVGDLRGHIQSKHDDPASHPRD